ncbi:hypothetical protein RGU70_06515 [Herbaspirillum sp. RTI4]|uniref:hypothetical protein n=1 Tax=Herbaspirillum sp. RTI4 TaxID=3048640 RepID=UPI002AB4319F|nr:hypothetical protein [Herbaspirillum sp. RTI4]MDY7577967.1 hypothetical protein [Herbaspirillum sp. RTI4]MEA9981587.1 hypothetical protein [Herbaspirillum sp. RTI4]
MSDSPAPLHTPGFVSVRKFIHAGQPSSPRLLDLEADPAEELRMSLPTGTAVGPALCEVLARYGQRGGVGRFVGGSAGSLKYHRIEDIDIPHRPYDYGTAFALQGQITFVTGGITIGQNEEGKILLHCHAGFINSDGVVHGGHLLLDDVIVGDDPLIIRLCLFSRSAFVVTRDEETLFSLLHPTPMEPQ